VTALPGAGAFQSSGHVQLLAGLRNARYQIPSLFVEVGGFSTGEPMRNSNRLTAPAAAAVGEAHDGWALDVLLS
jgi:hypothetical protein